MRWGAESMLASGGPVARVLGGRYEPRGEQVAMARAVADALASRGRLLVEAGTGVGKSFGYLLPAIARIVEHGERVVIATNTIALQEQLMEHDLPVMRRVFDPEPDRADAPEPFRAELVKGRGNYLSVRRLMLASKRQGSLFGDAAGRRSLHVIEDWAYGTEDGTLSTLPALERPGVWDRVQSDSGNCMGRKCPTYGRCFYQSARRAMERADLLVCNHALFFSDLALRAAGVGFLPRYDHVILDEAHMVEEVASDHFGVSLSEGRVAHLLSTLVRRGRGRSGGQRASGGAGAGYLPQLLVGTGSEAALERAVGLVGVVDRAREAFFAQVEVLSMGEGRGPLDAAGGARTARVRDDEVIEDELSGACRALAGALSALREVVQKEEDRYELNAYAERARSIADAAETLCERALEGCVYWAESRAGGATGGGSRATLACSPVEVGPLLRDRLFSGEVSAVLTSATLTTGGGGGGGGGGGARGGAGSFDHAMSRLGCEGAATLALGSPFDHAARVRVYADPTMPDPRERAYVEALAERVLGHVRATDGGAFVLFTSYRTMHRVADLVRGDLEGEGRAVVVQGRDGSRSSMLGVFRSDERGVLFGTSSFWQGVDVRGRGLRNVIITRLPFEPPDRPLTEARVELIRERGGDPFREDALPRAVLRFKQGFGRLVRSATDGGRVVVLDRRLVSSRYGALFLRALPTGVPVVVSPDPFAEPDGPGEGGGG